MSHTRRDGMILIILSTIGYACLPIFTKTLLAQGIDPLDIAFWRYLLTAPIFWGIVLVRGRRASADRPVPRRGALVMGALLAVSGLAALFSLERVPAGTFSVLFFTYPALVALLEALLGERLSLLAWAALGLTLVGVALTAPDFSAGLSGANLPGVLFALADALFVAFYFLASSRFLRGYPDVMRASAWTVTGTLIVLAGLTFARGLALPQGASWITLVGLALVSTVLPVFALNAGIQKLGSTRAAVISAFEPVLTALLALLFLGEVMLPIQWLGGVVIIVSVILLQLRRPEEAEETALARD